MMLRRTQFTIIIDITIVIVVGIAISALFIAFIPSVEMVAHDDRTPVAYPAASRGTLSLTSRARSNSIRATI